MFQDIGPRRLNTRYIPRGPALGDYLIAFRDGKVLFHMDGGNAALPQYETLRGLDPACAERALYLFSVEETAFFLCRGAVEEAKDLAYQGVQTFRTLQPGWLAFAGATAAHLAIWYGAHRYCGRCAGQMEPSAGERALYCPACGHVEYPKIAPAIIVGVTDGDRLLLTKYANNAYKNYALIAGFMEIGETLEDTVRREVQEEVGLRVADIRYYKSQPWAFSESLLVGFFANVAGDASVEIDRTELAEATWFSRDTLPHGDTALSLTWDMIEAFRGGGLHSNSSDSSAE